MTPLGAAAVLVALAARDPAEPDTTYGRIEGDVSLSFGLGATIGPRGPRAASDLRARYLDTVGLYATYEDAPLLRSPSDPKRVIAVGAELRPLFLFRWLRGHELGNARVDLAIDSLGLELGTLFAQPSGGSFGERPGFQLGGGLELPVLTHASGPWLGIHGGVRWSDAALAGDSLRGPSDRAAFVSFTIAWHQFFGAHAVDLNDKISAITPHAGGR